MSPEIKGLIIGALFGAALYLGGLADPDKIIGTLRLKDLHALRTILLFIVTGMAGIWILDGLGLAHYDIKPTIWIPVTLGGVFLGIGFGMSGYCPGTGLACAAAGRIDALVTVLGMFLGALVYILIYPSVIVPLESFANAGKVTFTDATGIPRFVFGISLIGLGLAALTLTMREPKPDTQG